MNYDLRDHVWHESWSSYYDAYFQEVLAERLFLRWQRIDELSKVLIALTASGSAISGWTLWSDPGYKSLWLLIAGVGAILSISHRSLDVSRKLSEWSSARSNFSSIRIDFENHLNEMKFDPNFEIKDFSKSLAALRKRYGQVYQETKVDAFITERLKDRVQDEVSRLTSMSN